MIDEKDIRKAATLTHNPALDAVANFAARNAFAAGVEWFKKALCPLVLGLDAELKL